MQVLYNFKLKATSHETYSFRITIYGPIDLRGIAVLFSARILQV